MRRVAHVEAAEEQDGLPDARLAQFQRFLDRGHPKPIHAGCGKVPGHWDSAVAVSVRLDHRHHAPRTGKLAHALCIAPQFGKRNLNPGGAEKSVRVCSHVSAYRNLLPAHDGRMRNGMKSLCFRFLVVSFVLEAGIDPLKYYRDVARGPISLLADNQLGF